MRAHLAAAITAASCLALVPTALADATAQALPFAQSWTDTSLITTSDDWSGVPGIEGFLGQDLTTATGTDPRTLLTTSSVAGDRSVLANQMNTGISNGDVAEFEIANPTIALQGSGTADAPYVLITLSTLEHTSIVVSYNLRDLDGSADNAVQPVALQYRVGTSGAFVNVAAGFVADATTGPSLATLVTAVSATLPAAAENQAVIQVRIITANAVGNDEWVGIDDLAITGATCGNGAVEPGGGEQCDDGNRRDGDCCDASCQIEAPSTICRPAVGPCDVAEACGGDGETPVSCPADAARTEGTACGGAPSGACDLQDLCSGSTGATAVCLARTEPAGTTCRIAMGACDVAELCDGTNPACPTDRFAADDTPCSDGMSCNGLELCRSGACEPGAALVCDDRDACTADACAEPGGCASARIMGCCNLDAECADDGDVCTAERCSGSGGTCQHLPITDCCTRDADCTGGGGCVAVSCNLGTHRCEPHTAPGCCASDADCSDGLACTRDLCDRATGACSNPAVMGCCVGAGDCDDGDSCTADRCDIVGSAASGTCAATAIASCCRTDADCSDSDGDLCTSPSCNTSTERCIETPVSCDDADACTADFCEIDGSCSHVPIMGCGGTDGGMSSMDDAGASGMDAGMGGDMDAALPDAGFTNDAASLRTDVPIDAGRLDRVDAGVGNEDAGDLTIDDTSGCHCAVPSPAGSSRGLWVGLGVVALALSRRRRAR